MDFYKIILALVLASVCVFVSCSSSEETQVKKQETDSLYIFDEIPSEDVFKFESPAQQSVDVYVVQIGAFSSPERAREFADNSRAIVNKDIKVEFNEDLKMHGL
ncbi:MAG: SPOR domain-containing protein [Ignavibacteriaceae bacterium]|nr:SPOR domain-containing protein [Ignavibacteriaceae bacterium]